MCYLLSLFTLSTSENTTHLTYTSTVDAKVQSNKSLEELNRFASH